MKEKINWPRFWISFLVGLIGLTADMLALIGFASGQLEIPNISLLNDPFVIAALSFTMMLFTVSITAFAVLELSKNRIAIYSDESKHAILVRGSKSVCSLLGIPAYLIWAISSLVILWSNIPPGSLPSQGNTGFGLDILYYTVSIFAVFGSIFIIPNIGPVLGGWIVDIHYLLSS